MTILSVVGARPQFIKAAPVSRLLRSRHREILVHTGQHYDAGMSDIFFRELELPPPDAHLGVGSASHAEQTAAMLTGLERLIIDERPDWVLVYGDTNSTLAGALAAAKLGIPIAHVEAGLRSFNRAMPEEINRVVVDHLSSLLLCPSEPAVRNLAAEGIRRGVHVVGDVMADALAFAREQAPAGPTILDRIGVRAGQYYVATVHRPANTDAPARLRAIFSALGQLDAPVVFPMHPRTRDVLVGLADAPLPMDVHVIEPLGYFDMVRLVAGSRAVLTDSGGLQKEAYWLGVPCVTLREETEWVETVEAGWNVLAGAETERIVAAALAARRLAVRPPLYGEGPAAARVIACLDAASRAAGRPS